MRRLALLLVFALSVLPGPVDAHEVRPCYLELKQTGAETYDVLWKVPAAGDKLRLGIYVRFPDGTEETSAHRARFVGGAYVERWSVRYPGGLADQTIHVDGLRATLTDVLVRVERLDGTTLVRRVEPAHPSVFLDASPSMWSVAGTYFVLGVEHILLGIDHLLFVLALLILVRGRRRLLGTITAFTVAHSITLAAATLGLIRVSGAPVEAVIALSIVFVAAEIIQGHRGRVGLTARAPWVVAFIFGLLHGFGFAGALHEVGLPDHAIPLALLQFNIGVEVGQLLFIAVVLATLAVLRRLFRETPRWVAWAPAYGIGTIAMYWTIERVSSLG